MVGNHTPTRRIPIRWMLTAFVLVVVWATLNTWRPNSPRTAAGPPQVARPSHQLAFAGALTVAGPPKCRWLQLPPQPLVEQAAKSQPAGSPQIVLVDDPLVRQMLQDPTFVRVIESESEPLVDREWPAEPRYSLDSLDPALRPWFSKLQQVDGGHPAWLLFAPSHAQSWRAGSRSLLEQWRQGNRSALHSAASPRYASPPSLLNGPMLTSPHDRLAMIPQSQTTRDLAAHQRGWDERVLLAMRPLLESGYENAEPQALVPEPTSLVAMLRQLAVEPECREWALESLRWIDALATGELPGFVTEGDVLERLAWLSQQAERMAEQTDDPAMATRLRRARYAMWRRIAIWHVASELTRPPVGRIALAGTAPPRSGHAAQVSLYTPVQLDQLLNEVEQYESSPSADSSRLLAVRMAQLSQSGSAGRQQLAETLSDQYRNANARVAISKDLVNRFLTPEEPRVEPVRDRIMGTPVSGQATTQSETSVTLLPDPNAWRLGLEVRGHANSQTIAFERTVRVRTVGTTNFAARQQVVINPQGMHLGRVVADANSASRFINARSDYDILPLVGGVIRSKARDAFSDRRGRAQKEVSQKASQRVEQQMSTTVQTAADRAMEQWKNRVINPLATGGVTIEPVEMRTTDKRLIARARVVHGQALTSHSPRPRAPSDSLASVQLHQSGLTNLVAALNLAGERLTAEQFAQRVRKFAPNMSTDKMDDDARETIIEFADETPVTFELADGKLHIAWQVNELVVRGRSNRDFTVHLYYVPVADGLVARFEHQAGPYLEGSMRNSQRMRLQTIFGKVFPDDGFVAVGTKYADDPRLSGLMITQLVIDDGWLGVALGPATENRSAQLDRYAPLWR
ncbi:hypothetical protein [Aeoliella sp.]|uniref:hypothetical protein n=1 Tax=Aeoliella sp. TaxID=2795800 RepID=UPI003CCC1D99